MEEIYRLKRYLVCISIVIALLSFTQYYAKWFQEKDRNNARFRSSPFYLSHVFDPNEEGYRYTAWTRQEWIQWLDKREIRHQKASPMRKSPLNQKPLNSVLIASPSEIINAFERRIHPYYPVGSSQKDRDLFWSASLFYSFVFERKGKEHRIYQCPAMYIAVKLVNGLPVHLHEHSKRREMRSFKVKVTKDCVELK